MQTNSKTPNSPVAGEATKSPFHWNHPRVGRAKGTAKFRSNQTTRILTTKLTSWMSSEKGLATIRFETLEPRRKLNQAPELLPGLKQPRPPGIRDQSEERSGGSGGGGCWRRLAYSETRGERRCAGVSRSRHGSGRRGVRTDPLTWRR